MSSMSDDSQYVLNRKAAADAESSRREVASKEKMLRDANAIADRGGVPEEHHTAEALAWCGYTG